MNISILLKTSFVLLATLVAVSLWLPFSAGILSLVCVFAAGWYVASYEVPPADDEPESPASSVSTASSVSPVQRLKYAALVPVLPSVVLQGLYLLDRAVYYPDWMNALFFIVNLVVVCFVGMLGGLVPYLRDRNRRRVEAEHTAVVNRGRRSIERLFASVVLAAFSTQFLVSTLLVPATLAFLSSVSPVHAETRQTVDQFFETYDPEKEYQPATEPIVPPLPPGSIPVSQMTPEQLEEYCLEYGYAAQDRACVYELPYYEGSPRQQPWYMQDPAIAYLVETVGGQKNGKTSGSKATIAKATAGKAASSSKQKGLLYHTGQFGKGIFDTGASLVVGLVKATVSAGSWIVKNPKQAATGVKNVVSLLNPMTAIPTVYKATQYIYNNRAAIAQTAVAIKTAGDRYGWNNVVSAALFSPEAVTAFHNQEYGYAIGRGLSEFALNIVTLIPPLAAAKIPVVGKQLATGISYINKVDDLISGVQLVKAVAKPAAEVFTKVPKAMGVAEFAESTIATAVRNPDVVVVVQKTVTTTEKQLPPQSVLQKGFNDLFDTNPAPVDVTKVNPQKVQQTTEALSKLYTNGNSYDNAFSTLNHNLETGRTTPEAVSRVLATTAEHKGIQHLVADTADPVVAQTITRNLTDGTAPVAELNTLGTTLQKQDLTPIAVKTNRDRTPEILTSNKDTGEILVHYTTTDGALVSKPYVPKQEDGFVGGRMFAQGDVGIPLHNRLDGTTDIKTDEILDAPTGQEKGTAAPSSSGGSATGNTGSVSPVSNLHNRPSSLPANPQKAAEAGSLPRPSPDMYISYDQLKLIEDANRRFIVDASGKAKIQGSHGIEKHVEKDAEYLEFRIDPAGENIDQASTFISKEVYEKEVNRVLQENWKEIEVWLKSDKKRDSFQGKPQADPIGIVLDKNPRHERISYQVDSIVLEKDGKGGYYILTNFLL